MIRTWMTISAIAIATVAATPAFAAQAGSAPSAAPVPSSEAPAPAPEQAQAGPVESDFASYDVDKSGTLDKKEFASWYLAKKQAEAVAAGKETSEKEVKSQVSLAFRRADSDMSTDVTQDELTQYLAA